MFILGFAGCIGALRENTFLLKFFSVFLGLIFFLELTAGILAFVFKDWIKDQLNFFINNNVKAYRDDIDLQNLIDFAQEYWSCCGAHGPNDWNLNIYFNCTEANPSRERCGVPFSCCVKDPAEDVLNTQCGYDVRLKVELDQQSFIYTKGCVGQFEKWLQDNLIVVAGVFVGIALLQWHSWQDSVAIGLAEDLNQFLWTEEPQEGSVTICRKNKEIATNPVTKFVIGKKKAKQSGSASRRTTLIMADAQDELRSSYTGQEKPPETEDYHKVRAGELIENLFKITHFVPCTYLREDHLKALREAGEYPEDNGTLLFEPTSKTDFHMSGAGKDHMICRDGLWEGEGPHPAAFNFALKETNLDFPKRKGEASEAPLNPQKR
ncbi:TSN17 protein, partial [Polypterus senegalus]